MPDRLIIAGGLGAGIRGQGLLWALELARARDFNEGLLCYSTGGTIEPAPLEELLHKLAAALGWAPSTS